MHGDQEVKMDRELREVLVEEGVGSHELSERDRLLENCDRVIDAERVKHGGEEHVLSDEGKLVVSLHTGLRMLKRLINLEQAEDLNQGEAHHEHDEAEDGHDEVPQVALNQHHNEASVKERVESGDLAHDELNHVPPVEAEDGLLLDPLLNSQDSPHFVAGCHHCLHRVDDVYPEIDALATLSLDEERRQHEHLDQVDEGQDVHSNAYTFHLEVFDLFERFRIEFVVESQVLRMNESLPDPDGKDDVVPTLELKLVAFVLRPLEVLLAKVFRFLLVEHPLFSFELLKEAFLPFLEVFDSLLILCLGDRVLNHLEVLVKIEHAHQHLQVLIGDLVMLDIELSDLGILIGKN